MKIGKILMGMAAAAAMAFAFTGCMLVDDGLGNDFIYYSDKTNSTINAEATAKINYTNESTNNQRGMKRFQNNKKGITANIVMENPTNDNGSVMGIVFDMIKNDDDTFNFVLFGMSNKSGKTTAYATYYKNVAEADFDELNFGKPNNSSDQIDITGWQGKNDASCSESDGFVTLNSFNVKDGELKFVVEIEALAKTAATKNEETLAADNVNAYKIRLYETPADGNLITFKGLSNKTGDAKTQVTNTAKYELAIPRNKIDAENDKTLEGRMGFYANVYAGKTLKGQWQVADMKHNPNVAKAAAAEDDDSFITIEY